MNKASVPQEWANLIGSSLQLPLTAIKQSLSEQVASLFPEKALIEGDGCSFDLQQFLEDGHCEVRAKSEGIHNQIETAYDGLAYGLREVFRNVWLEAEWQGNTLDILTLYYPQVYSTENYVFILANEKAIAQEFYKAVCDWGAEVRGEVLVFDGGGWDKSRELFEAIQNATLENLVLQGSLKDEIATDTERFFVSREQYERYRIPWKRGILFLGPPGNGKTHCVKALINRSKVPCLYVKSFKSEYATDQDNIRKVFQRARQTTPCILVMEDLDSLIDDQNRSFFLNELDGFAANQGILTLATTNHPERLDPAIVDRPSRFDRKYHFELPAEAERVRYITLWNENLLPELRLSESGIAEIAEHTEEFSFAYLKELFVSAVMQWINMPVAENHMDTVMRQQVVLLREQMNSMTVVFPDEANPDTEMGEQMRAAAMMMRRFTRRRR
jgi:hypothetical protein